MSRGERSPILRPLRGTLWVLAFGGAVCLLAFLVAALFVVVSSALGS